MRTHRWPYAIAALSILAAACSSSGHASTAATAPAPAVSTTTTVAPAPTAYSVGTRVETFVDKTRSTPKYSTYPGSPTRTLRARFFYPGTDAAPATTGAPYPLILFSHGLSGTPEVYAPLLRAVAAKGYVIAAPVYPLSNGNAPAGPTALGFSSQPQDASFVIDQTLAASGDAAWLHGIVDPTRIGASGHSLGAITTYALVFNTCCQDKRIKAAVVLSGITAGFPEHYFTGIHTPLLAIHGDHDQTLAYAIGKSAYTRAQSPKYMMTIIGGKHSSDELGGTTPGQRALTAAMIDFFGYYLRGDKNGITALHKVATTPGLTTFTAQP